METNINSEIIFASTLRQLAASFYDALLLLAILFIASAITVPFTQAGLVKPGSPILSLYYLLVCFFSTAGFWVRGGKTLGMHVWHLRVEQLDSNKISWKQALIRFGTGLPAWGLLILSIVRFAVPEDKQQIYFTDWIINIHPWFIFGLACVWIVFDHRPDSWRDRLSGTRVRFKK